MDNRHTLEKTAINPNSEWPYTHYSTQYLPELIYPSSSSTFFLFSPNGQLATCTLVGEPESILVFVPTLLSQHMEPFSSRSGAIPDWWVILYIFYLFFLQPPSPSYLSGNLFWLSHPTSVFSGLSFLKLYSVDPILSTPCYQQEVVWRSGARCDRLEFFWWRDLWRWRRLFVSLSVCFLLLSCRVVSYRDSYILSLAIHDLLVWNMS